MSARVTVVDLGLGNLGSVMQALLRAGGEPRLSADAVEIGRSARVVLPGVAAFGLGMDRAQRLGLRAALDRALQRHAPVLGICLGMQILFEEGEEDGLRQGLGFLPGRVTRLPAGVQVPHIGWQRLETTAPSPLLAEATAPWWKSRPVNRSTWTLARTPSATALKNPSSTERSMALRGP